MPGKQVPIEEAQTVTYHWSKWADDLIPGNAFDVTDDVICKTWGSHSQTARKHGLIVFTRNKRLWVGKPAADGVKDV